MSPALLPGRFVLGAVALLALTGPARPAEPPLLRVRVVEARRVPVSSEVVVTGDVQAQARTNVAFRTSGRVAERRVEVGDHVEADQVLAVLDPQTQRANRDDARAALVSAQALLTQAKVAFRRQEQLLSGGYTTRTSYDNAEQELRTTQAAVDAAQAALGTAQEQFSYTELRAGVPGIVLSRSFEGGQVVQSGETVLELAQDGPRDAVFELFEALLATPPADPVIPIALQSDPTVTAKGHVREIAPTVSATSGTVRVKVGLDRTPAGMTLGSVVVGRGRFAPREAIVLPWSALYRYADRPAVWTYDPATRRVAVRLVAIERYGADSIAVRSGLEPGERVVVAGIQFLRPDQAVEVVETQAANASAPGRAPAGEARP